MRTSHLSLPVILLLAVCTASFTPVWTANAGVISLFCWNGNLGPLPAPVPTIGCTAETIPAAGGGQEAFMELTYSCLPNCFPSTPVVLVGPYNANLPGSFLDQVEFNCTGSIKTAIVGASGYTVRHERFDVTIQVWSSDAEVGLVGVYCPFIRTDVILYSP